MDKKPATVVDIIIGKMKPGLKGPSKMERKPDPMHSEDFVEEVESSEEDIMSEAIAESLIQAIKTGDAKAVSQALKDWHEVCCGCEHGEGEAEEDDKLEY